MRAAAAGVWLVGLAGLVGGVLGEGSTGTALLAASSRVAAAQRAAARQRLGAKAAAAAADTSKTARKLRDIEHDLKLSIKKLAPTAKRMALTEETGGAEVPAPPNSALLVRAVSRSLTELAGVSLFCAGDLRIADVSRSLSRTSP